MTFRVFQLVFLKTNNGTRNCLNVATVSQTVRYIGQLGELTLHWKVPCPSNPSHGFLYHIIGTLNNVM